MTNLKQKRVLLFLFCLFFGAAVAQGLSVYSELKGAMLENLSSDPVSAIGRIYFNTLSNKARLYNGTVWGDVGSGSGSSSNLVSSPSTVTCWTKSGTVFSPPVTTTTAGDLPSASEGTAVQIVATNSGSESTNYVYCTVTTDADTSGYLPLTFSQRPGTGFAANEWTVSVYQSTNRVSLNTDIDTNADGIPDTTYLPNATTTIDQIRVPVSPSTTYTIRFARVNGSGSATHNIAKVFFVQAQLARVPTSTDEVAVTPSLNNGGTTSSTVGRWHRDNSTLYYSGSATFTGAGSASNFSVNLPVSGITMDTAKMSAGAGSGTSGGASWLDAGTALYNVVPRYISSTAIVFSKTNGSLLQGSDLASGDIVSWDLTLPIVEWANSGIAIPTNNNLPVNHGAHRNSSNQTLAPNASVVQVSMTSTATVTNGVGFTTGGGYDTSDGSFTVPIGGTGKYQINAYVTINSTNVLNNNYYLQIQKGSTFAGSSTAVRLKHFVPSATTSFSLEGSAELALSAGDKIYLGLFGSGNNSASTLTMDGDPSRAYWQITRLTDENNNPIPGIPYASAGVGGIISADTTTTQILGAGPKQLGQAVTLNYTGPAHKISGGLIGANVTSADQSGALMLSSNLYAGINASSRTDTTTNGAGLYLSNRDSNGNKNIIFYSNRTGQSTSTAADVVGASDPLGSWTFGIQGFASSGNHTLFGGKNAASTASDWVMRVYSHNCTGTSCGAIMFTDGAGDTVGNVAINASANTTSYGTSSDKRLKRDPQPFDALALAASMKPVNYQRVDSEGNDAGGREFGFYAQDLFEVYPQAVIPGGDDVKLNPWQVDYGKLTPVAIEAIKELKAQNEALALRVAILEGSHP